VDLDELGDAAPGGPVLVAYVPDEGAKAALLSAEPDVYFTTSHFDGYAAVLIQLKVAGKRAVREALVDAWLSCAPDALAEEYISGRRRRRT